jgi:ABC-type multidrug transport system fused ATPase/permease subunit
MKRIGMTQIVIAHRLSTIEDADTILYLERGHKIAEGPRDHLLATCPGFRTMWEMMQLPAVQS